MEAHDDYLIEQFLFDEKAMPEITKVIDQAYNRETRSGTISYDWQTLNILFGSPFIPRDVFVRVKYRPTGETVGFTGGIPRSLAYKGNIYRFGVPGFQGVPYPQHQRKGLAIRMNMKIIEIAKQRGFEGGFAIYEPEEHGYDAMMHATKDAGIQIKEILDIKQFVVRTWQVKRMSKVVDLKLLEKIGLTLMEKLSSVKNPRVRTARPEDYEQIYLLMHDFVERNELSVVREHNDFIWFLNQPGVLTVVHENEQHKVDGFIIAWKMNLAGYGRSEPFGFLDAVHIYNLSQKEATDLCKYFCIAANEAGWLGIQTPFIPYFDPKPFRKAKFIFYAKSLRIFAFLLKPIEIPDKVNSFYFDWR
jgi:hypothetical protein